MVLNHYFWPINNSRTIYSKPDKMSRRTMSRKKAYSLWIIYIKSCDRGGKLCQYAANAGVPVHLCSKSNTCISIFSGIKTFLNVYCTHIFKNATTLALIVSFIYGSLTNIPVCLHSLLICAFWVRVSCKWTLRHWWLGEMLHIEYGFPSVVSLMDNKLKSVVSETDYVAQWLATKVFYAAGPSG